MDLKSVIYLLKAISLIEIMIEPWLFHDSILVLYFFLFIENLCPFDHSIKIGQ